MVVVVVLVVVVVSLWSLWKPSFFGHEPGPALNAHSLSLSLWFSWFSWSCLESVKYHSFLKSNKIRSDAIRLGYGIVSSTVFLLVSRDCCDPIFLRPMHAPHAADLIDL
jgi:hypothetical protein